MLHADVTGRIIRSAIKVHSALGPGLLESAYQACLAYEMQRQGLSIRCEAPLALSYDGIEIDCGYRLDFIVEEVVIVELKSVERLEPVHDAQLLTYLKLTGLRVGLLMNFNAITIMKGTRRFVR